jgi:hypothetical protein
MDGKKDKSLDPLSLANRIQFLLLPQHWPNVSFWIDACATVCSDFRKATIDPQFKPALCAQWLGKERPIPCWPFSYSRQSVCGKSPSSKQKAFEAELALFRAVKSAESSEKWDDAIVDVYSSIEDFPNALWGWFSMIQWFREIHESYDIEKHATELFYILMQCGCSNPAILNSINQQERSLVSFCVQFPWVVQLFLTRDELQISPKPIHQSVQGQSVCLCDVCPIIAHFVRIGELLQREESDIAAVNLLQRMNHSARINLLHHHWWPMFALDTGKLRCFSLLWSDIKRFLSGSASPRHKSALAKRCATLTILSNPNWYYHNSLLSLIAGSPDSIPWKLFTDNSSPFTNALLDNENCEERQSHENISPLSAALFAGHDQRAAWLASRLRM